MKITQANRELLRRRLANVPAYKRTLKERRVQKIATAFCKEAIRAHIKKAKKPPTVGDAFDAIAPELMTALRLLVNAKAHLIAKFIARIFVKSIG